MSKNNNSLRKPHLLEMSILRRILNQTEQWMDLYKNLTTQENYYVQMLETSSDSSFYKKKCSKIKKRIDILTKRISLDSLKSIYVMIFDRLDSLYKLDADLQKSKSNMQWRKE